MRWYRNIVRPLLFRLSAEAAHDLAGAALRRPQFWAWMGDHSQVRDPRLEVEHAWELFAPELVAEWPAQTVVSYLPRHFPHVADGEALRRRRDAVLADAEVLCLGFPFPTRIVSRAPRLRRADSVSPSTFSMTR